MGLFDSVEEIRSAITALGGISVQTVPPGASPIIALYSTEHVSIPLVGESISADSPTLLLATADAPSKGAVIDVDGVDYKVRDSYRLDDGALTLLEMHRV